MNNQRFGPEWQRPENNQQLQGFRTRYRDRFERCNRAVDPDGNVVDIHQSVSGSVIQSDGQEGRVLSESMSTGAILACGCLPTEQTGIVRLQSGHLVCDKCRPFYLCSLCIRDIAPDERVHLTGMKKSFHPRCALRILDEILWAVRLKKMELDRETLIQYRLIYQSLKEVRRRPGLFQHLRAALGNRRDGGNNDVPAT